MRRLLYIAVVVAGMTSLGIEMAASRLLGNVFGTSNLVWASIIGLILIYLAAGYFIGGRWADRHPYPQTFYQILIWSGVATAVIPWMSRPVLRLAANAFDALQFGVLGGSLAAVVILLCVPMILLGTASPFAIRLAIQDTQAAGRVSGRIYALSTLGSFVGTFLPVLLLIPTIGTYRTFLVFSLGLILMGLIGLGYSSGWRKMLLYSWAPILVLIIWLFGLPGTDKNTKGMIYEGESAYNYIQVIEEKDGTRKLRLNEGQGTHSEYKEGVENYNGPWEQVLVAPFFYPPPVDPANIKSMAIVGLAAGTTARQATLVYGDIAIDGIEIDPKIVDIGRKYFAMNMPNLNVIIQDGRWGLEHSQKHYEIISVDAYRPPYIPWHLTTREFFTVVREHLTENGTLVINVGRSPMDRRLINSLASTMQGIFPSIHVVDVPNSFNSILFATVQPTNVDDLVRNWDWLKKNKGHPLLIETMEIAALNLQPAPAEGIVFTDDRAPVEWITNQMILNFIFSDQMETLQ